jgi:molecular chaperone GrpE (heat shock protein)
MYSYLEKDKLAIAQKELRLVSGLFESVVNRLQNDEQKHWEEMNKLNELFEKENEEFHKYVTKKVIPKLQKLS